MKIKYRVASLKDLEKIYYLNAMLARYESRFNDKLNYKVPKAEFMKAYTEKLAMQKSTFFIAEKGDEIIGYVFGWIELSSYVFKYEDKGIIAECFVREEYRKQGIGKALVKNMFTWFENHNISWIKVDVLALNKAKEFWRHMGFKDFTVSMSMNLE
jgi:GNAT superfamily N-acetyltransferase